MAALLTPAASSLSRLMAQGRESAAALEALLRGASPQEHGEVRELASEILRCCDRALAALHGGGRKRGPGHAAAQTRPGKRTRTSGGETAAAKRVEKKWTAEDGFIWRKYGQKEILHSKHPRLYFRCTYKDDSGCRATRQVQLSEDDPSLYVITYFGEHTCCHGDNAVLDCDNAKMQPFVINFGSAAATSGGGSPPWLSSCSDDGDGHSETSRSSQAAGSPEEEDMEELGDKVTKIEPASSDHPSGAELSSSPDASCCSPPWDPLAACSDWDIFNEASFNYVISDYFEL